MANVVTISYDARDESEQSRVPTSRPKSSAPTRSRAAPTPAPPAARPPRPCWPRPPRRYTDPNGNVTTIRPDWYGLGMTGVAIDALGDVATYDLNSNGLPTSSIDPLNRITHVYLRFAGQRDRHDQSRRHERCNHLQQ